VPTMIFIPSESIAFANCLTSLSVGNVLVCLGLCKKRARAENAQNYFLPFPPSTATTSAVLFLFNVTETNVLRASSPSEFSHSLGHFQTSARVTRRSASPPATDIVGQIGHVREVPFPEVVTIRLARQRAAGTTQGLLVQGGLCGRQISLSRPVRRMTIGCVRFSSAPCFHKRCCSRIVDTMRTGSGSLPASMARGQTFRRNAIAKTRSASALIFIAHAT
jgi:hypothetical protein